ncbi:fibrobacter succinogenes major paralogous domain-containing protein [Parabacteroides sp. OttesenSCG-928-K15]|nr:fibrobacter succinogenes major paralogous domain-containing protein [Parabacteroides sp. OttesenSCG-928-K15]
MKVLSHHKYLLSGKTGRMLFGVCLSLFLFVSCSEEQQGDIQPMQSGDAVLRMDIRNEKKSGGTYAETELAAFPIEKEIHSIAFFTQTENSGTNPKDPNFKLGAFNKFFSHEPSQSPYGLYEPLEAVNGGGYRAAIRIASEAMGNTSAGQKTRVIVIANYIENGMKELLTSVNRWEDLFLVFTPEITKNIQAPLLMYAVKEDVMLKEGETENTTFNLQRVVARIDVENRASDPDPAKGFVLESAQLLYPRSSSSLLPDNPVGRTLPTLDKLPAITAGNPPANDPTRIVGMYVYETDNSGIGGKPTAVFIKGKLFGRPFTREIALRQAEVSHAQQGDPIPMLRNHLYKVVISPLVSEEVEVGIDIVDWSDGTELSLKPTQKIPVLSDITVTNLSGATLWNEAKKTYTYDGKQNEVIHFKATGNQAMFVDFAYEYKTPNTSVGLEDFNSQAYQQLIKQSEPVVSYASVSQEFTITLPTFEAGHPAISIAHIKLYIHNALNPYYVDSISVKCMTPYDNSPYYPVKVNGLYWAPLNVGATTTMGSSSKSTASTGYYFQWGRNKAFDATTSYSTVTTSNSSYEKATTGTDKDKFICGCDWLKSTDSKYNTRKTLWSKAVNDSPCPSGWRVPTKSELEKLKAANPSWISTEYRFRVMGEDGEYMYIPKAGVRYYDDSKLQDHNSIAYLWSSEMDKAEYPWNLKSAWDVANGLCAGRGMNIRCVQE